MRIGLAGLALLIAADAAAAPAAPAAFRAEDRAIFTAEAAAKQWPWLFRAGATPWTPTVADAEALEQRLPDYLRRELAPRYGARKPKSPPLWERISGYKRQLVGIDRKGRRTIYANFFCSAWNKDWRTEPIVVNDGGDCYVQAEYDVEKKTFSNMMINGEA